MEFDKGNNEFNFSDLDDELNDYEVEKGKIAGFDFDALDFEESKKENFKQQETSTKAEKKSGRATKKRRVLSKVDYEKLIGPDGLAKLKEQGPKLKFADSKKSKDATIDNLKTIVNFYQTWAHGLCPQMKFKDVIFQSENVCKEKRLKHYLDGLREEAKNKQNDRNDYLSGKTLADEESVFWHTPSQSASRNKRVSSFEDRFIGQNNDDDLIVRPRLLFTSNDGAEKNSPIEDPEEIIVEPFQLTIDKDLTIDNDLEGIVQNVGSPIRHNILRPRRLVYDGEPDDILGDQSGAFDDVGSPSESRDDILISNKQALNMDMDQIYEDPTSSTLSPGMNSSFNKRNLHYIYEDNGDGELSLAHGEILNACARDLCKNQDENDDIVGSDKENSQPCTTELPMSKRSTLFFDLGDRYVDLTPIYEEANAFDKIYD
ncbi:replication fork protection component Swi3-domain-containing protein [Glomus cerebriforme]|uniref:Chromosome segregation in meiosis protein n=1 Tax=Glomus cerebriforme TaxID=658196 RepID=A0A397T3A8_9GLOM|nr:replication fork protection component Swi3-domain-containing protein [Glomus cerebriforme]